MGVARLPGKKLKIIFFIVALFLIIFQLPHYCYAFDDNDFQYWNREGIEAKLAENWKIAIYEEFRFGDNASSFYYNHTDIGLGYLLDEHFEFSVNYRQVFRRGNNNWNPEYKPHINGAIKAKWYGFSFKNRSRFVYIMKDNSNNVWRCRNEISAAFPFKVSSFDIAPYLTDEIFYDFGNKGGFDENWALIGLKIGFLENLKGDIYYMRQSYKGSKWKGSNVFGTSLTLMF